MKSLHFIFSFTLCVLLTGCASKSIHFQRKLNDDLRKHAKTKNFDQAIKLVKDKEYYPEKRSELVRLLNQASILYYKGKYPQALLKFNDARDLSERLYTVSISKRAKTLVTNDNLDNYYGEVYERSLIRFYTALVSYKLYEIESNKTKARAHLFNARAAILDWDTYLDSKQYDLAGRPTYKADLAAKVFGAMIHEEIGTSSELQIAKQLYKDADKILKQNYGAYPTYNAASRKYVSDYGDLPKKSSKELKAYTRDTANATIVKSYIKSASKSMRKKKHNAVVLINYGLISPKTPKVHKFPMAFGSSIIPSGKSLSISAFAAALLSVPAAAAPEIKFEQTTIDSKANKSSSISIEFKQKGRTIKKVFAAIINPISDIAKLEVDNQKLMKMGKTGARVAAKHIGTMTALYITYKIALKKGGITQALALPLAVASYKVTAGQLAKGELADLREWTLLPHYQAMAKLKLSPGDYEVFVNGKMLKRVTIPKSRKTQLIDIFAP